MSGFRRQGGWGLADHAYQAADGDPIRALLLALDFQKLAAEPRWPLNTSGNRGPKAQEAATSASLDTHASAQPLLQAAPPGSLTDELAA